MNITKLVCRRCKHKWVPRKKEVITCPRCKSYLWAKPKKKRISKVLAIIFLFLFITQNALAVTASWYDTKSCKREGTSGIMANGKELNDNAYTCASWDYRFDTVLRVTNLSNGKRCLVRVTDRGPNKKLYLKGRKIDLSRAAFGRIANLEQGVIEVSIEEVR